MAGDQVPLMPLLEVVSKGGIEAPLQNGPGMANVGVTFGFMVIVRLVVVAHWPAVGVNVYVVVAVLLIAGDQVPVIPLVEVVGKAGMVAPLQYGPTAANAGVMLGFMVIVKVVVVAHWPAVGVKV